MHEDEHPETGESAHIETERTSKTRTKQQTGSIGALGQKEIIEFVGFSLFLLGFSLEFWLSPWSAIGFWNSFIHSAKKLDKWISTSPLPICSCMGDFDSIWTRFSKWIALNWPRANVLLVHVSYGLIDISPDKTIEAWRTGKQGLLILYPCQAKILSKGSQAKNCKRRIPIEHL